MHRTTLASSSDQIPSRASTQKPSTHSTPGSLDLNPSKKVALYEAIQKALALKQKIKIFLDFDDTMIFINLVTPFSSTTESSYVNMHLINFLVELFSNFGVESFKLEILSARKADEYMPKGEEHIKIQRLLPAFLNELNKRLAMHEILPEHIQRHCLKGKQLHVYKKVFTQNVNGKEMLHAETLPNAVLFHEQEFNNPYGEEQITKRFESQFLNLAKEYPNARIIKTRAELTKANYLDYCLGVRNIEEQNSTLHIHIDDNEYELRKIQALNCVHIVRVIPQPRGNVNQNQVIQPTFNPLSNIPQRPALAPKQLPQPTPELTKESYFEVLENHSLFTSRKRSPDLVRRAAAALQKQKSRPRDATLPPSNSRSNRQCRPDSPLPQATPLKIYIPGDARTLTKLQSAGEDQMANPFDQFP